MRHFILVGFLLGFLGLSLGLANTSYADPPPWAPAHGYRAKHHKHKHKHTVYHYHYYPAYEVYYNPVRRQYFWLDGGAWKVGVKLPSWIQIGSASPVLVDIDDERPYVQHLMVKAKYK